MRHRSIPPGVAIVWALGVAAALLLAVLGGLRFSQEARQHESVPMGEAVAFPVVQGELRAADDGAPPDGRAREAWALLSAIAGPRAESIVELAVFDDEDESTMASMARDLDDPTLWYAEINLAYAHGDDLPRTLVHEYAHLLSLASDQVAFLQGSCPTFEFSEGCVEDDSHIGAFLDEFWSDEPRAAVDELASEDDAFENYEERGADEVFVSEYAATNGAEDFAETFAAYVLDWPARFDGNATVAEQKVAFMSEAAERAAERSRIREALGLSD